MVTMEDNIVDIGGLFLHVVQAGPATGEPVILLHGFPDAWFAWQKQLQALAVASMPLRLIREGITLAISRRM
ncbi:alpha/beta fold hydrolase [Pontibacter rugosus]